MTDLVHNDQLDAEAIAASTQSPAVISELIAGGGVAGAAAALVAGIKGHQECSAALIAALDDEDMRSRAAAWALGQLDSEQAVLSAIAGGGIDVRTNGYHALCALVARGAASGTLAAAMHERVADEVARAESGRTGLGDQACRVLACLGDAGAADAIAKVMAADPYADRFELERQRKQLESNKRDEETLKELEASWQEQFADDIHVSKITVESADEPIAADEIRDADFDTVAPAAEGAMAADEPLDDDIEPGAEDAQPIDWDAFTASDAFTGLADSEQNLISQLGPMLEQLAAQAVRVPLTALGGQEVAAILLQVLPQAVPPQVVQAALSPQALNGYQALFRWLGTTGLANANDLVDGIKLVRQELREQIRSSGMLGGPDYSDPDELTE